MLGTLLAISLAYFTWLVYRRYTRSSPLDSLSGPAPSSRLFGNIPQLVNPKGWDFHFHTAERYGGIVKMMGVLGERFLVVSDAKALHHILVKDQDVYEVGATSISRANLLFGPGVLGTLGHQHRKQRRLLNPVFSTNHMRDLVPIFYEVTERLRVVLKKKLENGPQEIDLLHWIGRTALEIIGKSGMDYSFDSLEDDGYCHPYAQSVKKLPVLISGPMGFLGSRILPSAMKINLPRVQRFIAEQIPLRRIKELIEVIDLMYSTSIDIIEAKKKAMASPHPEVVAEMANKKDIISVLLRANAKASEEDKLSDKEVIGQISTFIFAGMDTTTSAVARILHLLAMHQIVQEKLQEEIREAQGIGQLDYEQLNSLPYLDAVCRETLRLHPPVNLSPTRSARQDIILPLSKPILDSTGKEVTEILVSKGTNIMMSILAANRNPDLWGPDSHEWKPERWLGPLPKALEEAHVSGIYSHLMTFTGGRRACIGFKFSQLEMKVMLCVLLSSFQFSLSDKTIGWRMTAITGPFVEGVDDQRSQLPLQLSLLE